LRINRHLRRSSRRRQPSPWAGLRGEPWGVVQAFGLNRIGPSSLRVSGDAMSSRHGSGYCEDLNPMPSRFQEVLSMILEEFGPRVVSVTMFGSRVKGGARHDSDYDMIIVMEELDSNPNLRDEFVASAVSNILLASGIRISPVVLTRTEATSEAENGSPLLASILSGYEILYDPARFMAGLLDLTKRSRTSLTYVERGRAWNLARTV